MHTHTHTQMKAGLEARQQSLVEQLMSVKEKSARKEAESANTLRQLSQLQEVGRGGGGGRQQARGERRGTERVGGQGEDGG